MIYNLYMVFNQNLEIGQNLPVPDQGIREPMEAVVRFEEVVGDWGRAFSQRMEKNSHLSPRKQQYLHLAFQKERIEKWHTLDVQLYHKLLFKAHAQGMISPGRELSPATELFPEAVAQRRLRDLRVELEEPYDNNFDEFILGHLNDASQKLGNVALVDLACKEALAAIDSRVQNKDIIDFEKIVDSFYDFQGKKTIRQELTKKETELFENLKTLCVVEDGKVNFPFSITSALQYVKQKAVLYYFTQIAVPGRISSPRFSVKPVKPNVLGDAIMDIFESSDLERNPSYRRSYTMDELDNSIGKARSARGHEKIMFGSHYERENLRWDDLKRLFQYPDLDYIWKK